MDKTSPADYIGRTEIVKFTCAFCLFNSKLTQFVCETYFTFNLKSKERKV